MRRVKQVRHLSRRPSPSGFSRRSTASASSPAGAMVPPIASPTTISTMTRARLLRETLGFLMELRVGEAAAHCGEHYFRTADPYALSLGALAEFWRQDFGRCAELALAALEQAEDVEARFVARAAWGLGASADPSLLAGDRGF